MKYLIGIDVGTTGTKALLFTETGRIVKTAYRGYGIVSDRPDYAEQEPSEWYRAAADTVRQCTAVLKDSFQITAISVSAQGGTTVAVDKDGIPVRRAVSWLDRRAKREAEELCRGKEQNYYYLNTGWRLNDGYNLAQIKWMKAHEPDLFEKTALFLSPLDYLNLRLSGKAVSDFTNEGITNLENLHSRDWDLSIFDDLQLLRSNLPQLEPAGTVIGKLTKAASLDLGLTEDTMVINGGYDQYCAALGLGAIYEGDVMLSTGTAWVLIAVTNRLVFDTDTFSSPCMHIIPDCFGVMASLETGGVSMDWFKDKVASCKDYKETYETMNTMIEERGAGADGLLFYPHLAGTTCPYWSKNSRGAFVGLTLFHDRYHMARAVMEGVVYEICEVLDSYQKQGMKTQTIKLVGGASKSKVWTQMIADISGVSVEVYDNADAAAIGAGIIAAKGAGYYENFEQAADAFRQNVVCIEPNQEVHVLYKKIRQDYHSGFECLKKFYDWRARGVEA